jgi:ABC-type uncharacterized transport system permease subunit
MKLKQNILQSVIFFVIFVLIMSLLKIFAYGEETTDAITSSIVIGVISALVYFLIFQFAIKRS